MKYPGGIVIKKTTNNIEHANRGMSLENDINLSNEFYVDKNIAYIYKKPTPIQIVKVDYPSRNKAIIKEAYFKEPSTTDYNGLYKGKYIDFEAKETRSKTSFTLSNIHEHQIKHLKNISRHNGIAFLIVRFTTLNKTFLLKAEDLLSYMDNNERKSIPLEYFEEKGYLLKDGYNPRIDYLKVIDSIIGG